MKERYVRKLQVQLVDGDFENPLKDQVRDPEQLVSIFRDMKDWSQETLIGVYLGEKLSIKVYGVLSMGSSRSTLLDPREVFKQAFITDSRTFVLLHNHPSGDPAPSPEDRECIQVIQEQSKTLELEFLDFIIVGQDSFWSLFDEADGGEYGLGAIQ